MRGRIRTQSVGDHFQHAIHIVHNVVIPEAKDFIIMLSQPLIAHEIACTLGMLTAIHFYNQSLLATNKVDDISTDRLLTNKFVTINRA